jgi:hypothetical protein
MLSLPSTASVRFVRSAMTQRWSLALLVAGWVAGVLGGFYLITDYEVQSAPGITASKTPSQLSSRSPSEPKWVLQVFLHPHCPCSRATVAELARVMEHADDTVVARVFFMKPAGRPDGWEQSEMWRSAAAIRGVEVLADVNGSEAIRCGASTSGQTILYDPQGRLRFSGGITASRGHFGTNAASDQLIALLTQQRSEASATPVFGCPLIRTHSSNN